MRREAGHAGLKQREVCARKHADPVLPLGVGLYVNGLKCMWGRIIHGYDTRVGT